MATVIVSLKYSKDDVRKASFADFIPFESVIQWGVDTFDLKAPVSASLNGTSVADVKKTLSDLAMKDGDVIEFFDANNPRPRVADVVKTKGK